MLEAVKESRQVDTHSGPFFGTVLFFVLRSKTACHADPTNPPDPRGAVARAPAGPRSLWGGPFSLLSDALSFCNPKVLDAAG